MDNIFLAHHFGDVDRDLVRDVSAIIESHGLRVVTGDVAGGESLTDEIKALITGCECPNSDSNASGRTADREIHDSSVVTDELQFARHNRKRAIALRHSAVLAEGAMYRENEHITYDPGKPVAAFVKLSKTIGKWRKDDGRIVQLMLAPPDEIGKLLSRNPNTAECVYRSVRNGQKSDWRTGLLQREVGGVFAFVNVEDGSLVEIRLRSAGEQWSSPAIRQWIPVELERENS